MLVLPVVFFFAGIGFIFLLVLIFFACREISFWFWRRQDELDYLKNIEVNTRNINARLKYFESEYRTKYVN